MMNCLDYYELNDFIFVHGGGNPKLPWNMHPPEILYWDRKLFEFVKKSNVSKKIFYSEILATQLSAHEKLLIFYHCLSKGEINKFKPLAEEFSFFKDVSSIELIDENNHYQLFEKTAYGTIG
jgi:hypothetical protein